MIKKGGRYFPLKGEVKSGGKYTAYTIGDQTYNPNGTTKREQWVRNGWVTILSEINRPLDRGSGVCLYVDEIDGWKQEEYPPGSGKYRSTLYCKVHLGDNPRPNDEHLSRDIPDGFTQVLDRDEIPF